MIRATRSRDPAAMFNACSFTRELINNIQQWVNTIVPTEEYTLRNHCQIIIVCLLSQVTIQHDTMSTTHASTVADHAATIDHDGCSHANALVQVQDAVVALQADNEAGQEMLAEQKATIKALSILPPGAYSPLHQSRHVRRHRGKPRHIPRPLS